MSFYSQFAHYYQQIFPYKQPVYSFMKSYTSPNYKSILDIGCGTGHYAQKFFSEGFQSTGIDLDNSMIGYAIEHNPGPNYFALDMTEIETLSSTFDFIFCIGNTAAHLAQSEFESFVGSVYNVLMPGGIWLFQVRNWDYVAKQQEYEFPILKADPNIKFFRNYSEITAESLYFNTRLTDQSETVFEDRIKMYPINSQRYLDIHKNCRFKLIDQFGDFQRTPFQTNIDSANMFVFQK